jgi:Zinc finger, C3HC4 type (RING finger)
VLFLQPLAILIDSLKLRIFQERKCPGAINCAAKFKICERKKKKKKMKKIALLIACDQLEGGGAPLKLIKEVENVGELKLSILERANVGSARVDVLYLDADFDEYVVLDADETDLEELPAKLRIKLIPKTAAKEPGSVAASSSSAAPSQNNDESKSDDENDDDVDVTTKREPFLPESMRGRVMLKASYSYDDAETTVGIRLPKGYEAEGRQMTFDELERARAMVYSSEAKKYVVRDDPLTDDELACWQEQSQWLCCPVSGNHWRDERSIIGVGIYHAPRFLGEAEKRRQSERDRAMRAAINEKSRQEAADAEASDDDEPESIGGVPQGPKLFQVYPTVEPPGAGQVRRMGELPDNVHVGRIEVIVGPAFDRAAYNWGAAGDAKRNIKSKRDRGSLDMDQQYNALNFCYYVAAGAAGKFKRCACTNRLSFYIEEEHGSRVFPANIESQLALLVYRNSKRLIDPVTRQTDQRLLARCIKLVIPRTLKAIVGELLNTKSEMMEARLDKALRLYLLIHQIAIKLVLHYRETYEHLYRSVVRWLTNPFTDEAQREWPDLEELLIAASLVGVPWALLREAFMRKLMGTLVLSGASMRDNANAVERMRHIFNQNRTRIHRILYCFSFFVASRPLRELDRAYSRCAGSLPAADRARMKEMALAVRDIDSLESFWRTLGGDAMATPDDEARRHLAVYIDYVREHMGEWRERGLPASLDSIRVPDLSAAAGSVAALGILGFRNERAKALAEHRERLRATHRGMPVLTAKGTLDRNRCGYPQCGRIFNCRSHLFAHVRQVFGNQLQADYHKLHHNLRHVEDRDCERRTCEACGEIFEQPEQLFEHYQILGVPGYFRATDRFQYRYGSEPTAASSDAAAEQAPETKDQYEDLSTCVICLDDPRDCVLCPCGHLALCAECITMVTTCPICRVEIVESIPVAFGGSIQSIRSVQSSTGSVKVFHA